MTSQAVYLFNLLLFVASFLIPLGQLLFNKNEEGLKRITTLGKVAFVYSFLVLLGGVGSYHVSNWERQEDRDSIINAVQTALQGRNLIYDPSTGRIVNGNPVLIAISNKKGVHSPVVTGDIDTDTLMYLLSFRSTSPAIAKNIQTHFVTLNRSAGTWAARPSLYEVSNESLMANNEIGHTVRKPIYLNRKLTQNDTIYLYAKISFTNSKGEPQEPLRDMSKFYLGLVDKNLPATNQDTYNEIKQFLQTQRLW